MGPHAEQHLLAKPKNEPIRRPRYPYQVRSGWDRGKRSPLWKPTRYDSIGKKKKKKKEKMRGWKKKSPTHGPFTDQNRSSVSTSRSISLRSDRIADLYDLHKARYISWVGSVLYRSCAVSHNGRYGSRWILAREPFSLLQRFPRAIFE